MIAASPDGITRSFRTVRTVVPAGYSRWSVSKRSFLRVAKRFIFICMGEEGERSEVLSPNHYQLKTLSRSSSLTSNFTLCGARDSVEKYRGSLSCCDVKPALALKSLSI